MENKRIAATIATILKKHNNNNQYIIKKTNIFFNIFTTDSIPQKYWHNDNNVLLLYLIDIKSLILWSLKT